MTVPQLEETELLKWTIIIIIIIIIIKVNKVIPVLI